MSTSIHDPAWPDLAGHLVDGLHRLGVRVYYEDTDFSGIVYHATYVRWFERGRSDYLRLCGIHHSALIEEGESGIAFAVRSMQLEFLKPASIDNILEVRTRLTAYKGARLELEQQILRGDDCLVSAHVKVAIISGAGRPVRLPAELGAKLTVHLND